MKDWKYYKVIINDGRIVVNKTLVVTKLRYDMVYNYFEVMVRTAKINYYCNLENIECAAGEFDNYFCIETGTKYESLDELKRDLMIIQLARI